MPVLLLQSVLLPGDIAVMLEDPEPPPLGCDGVWTVFFLLVLLKMCKQKGCSHITIRKMEKGSQLKKKHEEI